MSVTVRHRRPAMATLFEIVLVGDDREHLTAVAEAALDEIVRVEQLLSRFDPASEITRINRQAGNQPVRIDYEVLSVLADCRSWWERTSGYFDIAASSSPGAVKPPGVSPAGMGAVELDEDRRTVRFVRPDIRIDLGGYGKGYALDMAGQLLDQYGVGSALLHGGASSLLLRGDGPDGAAWRIGLRDPFAGGESANEIRQLRLRNCGFSSSAACGPSFSRSNIINPRLRAPLHEQAGCSVVAATALDAEVLSTALLAMGKQQAMRYTKETLLRQSDEMRVAWIDQQDNQPFLQWFTEPP